MRKNGNIFTMPDWPKQMIHCIRKPTKCLGENKGADQLTSAFVFATRIVPSLFYLNTIFQASNHLPNDVEFKIPLTNAAFVNTFLSNLNISKSTGLDNIGPKILKLSANTIAPSLVYIINKIITSGTFPSVWKEAKVKPLFKSGDKDDINNYRPISILPTVSKLIEKWVDVNFSLFLNNFSLLHKSQSGFHAKHSTESAMILMVDSWLKALNSGKLVGF